ncbi:MAG TPA: DNRLRE domain-containing protein, partial [Planctomycetota bacterium]|nr:DNRLRE domain-containing protein [Planctomycetota bacterium]
TSKYGTSYSDGTSRWEFAARLEPGKNSLVVAAPAYADRLWKDVQNVDIYMYQPHEGESITVDNIRLSTEVPKAVSPFDDTKVAVPPANPEKPFEGWADAGTPSHGPTGLNMACFANAGKRGAIETCFRNRPGFLRVDLSWLPRGAQILSARLIVVRAVDMGDRWQRPTMHVAEPCNRPWREYEANVYECAKDQFWNQYAGMTWGDEGDFSALLLARGPTGGKTSSWDFTHAVKYWTEGQHPNHGFILYGVPNMDYLNIFSRECEVIGNRPCLAVIYEPKP